MTEPTLDLLRSEIADQPRVLRKLLEAQRTAVRRVAAELRGRPAATFVLVARGSSDNAAVYGRYLFEVCNRRLTSLAAPSSITLYDSAPRLAETVVIAISQSGRGEDVLAYVAEARAQGALTLAIVNDESSPLSGAAAHVLACCAGAERSIPATKTVTAQMMLLAMLSACLSDASCGLDPLRGLPTALESALDRRPVAAELAHHLAGRTIDAVIGRGFAFPVALELALKLKETAYTHAEPFSAADFLHGPVALVESDYTAVVVDVGGHSSAAAREIATGVRARGGEVVLLQVGGGAPTAAAKRADRRMSSEFETHTNRGVNSADLADGAALAVQTDLAEPYAPIVAVVLGQLLAVEFALARGLDPAQPRGLRKVTSTR